jgi:hypothetical protein
MAVAKLRTAVALRRASGDGAFVVSTEVLVAAPNRIVAAFLLAWNI